MQELIKIRIEELQKLRDDLVAKQKIDLDKIDVRIEELIAMVGGESLDTPQAIVQEVPANIVESPVEALPPIETVSIEKEADPIPPMGDINELVTEIENVEDVDAAASELVSVVEDVLATEPTSAKPEQPLAVDEIVAATTDSVVEEIVLESPAPEPEPPMPPGLDDVIENIATKTDSPAETSDDLKMPPGLDDILAETPEKDDIAMPSIDDGPAEMSNDDIEAMLTAQL